MVESRLVSLPSRIEAPTAVRVERAYTEFQNVVSEQQRLVEQYTKTIAPIRQEYDDRVEELIRHERYWHDRYTSERLKVIQPYKTKKAELEQEIERLEAKMAGVSPAPSYEEYIGGVPESYGAPAHFVLETAWTDPYTGQVYGLGEKISVEGFEQLTTRAEQYNIEQVAAEARAIAEAAEAEAARVAAAVEQARIVAELEAKKALITEFPEEQFVSTAAGVVTEKELAAVPEKILFAPEPKPELAIPEILTLPKEIITPEKFLEISKETAAAIPEVIPEVIPEPKIEIPKEMEMPIEIKLASEPKMEIPELLTLPKEEIALPKAGELKFGEVSTKAETFGYTQIGAEQEIFLLPPKLVEVPKTPGVTGYLSVGKEKTIDIDIPFVGKVVIPAEPFFEFIGPEAEKVLVDIHAKQQEVGETLRATMFQAGQFTYERATDIVIGVPEAVASVVEGRPFDLEAARKEVFETEFGGLLEPAPYIEKAKEAEWLIYKPEPITVPKKTGEEIFTETRMWAGTAGQLIPLAIPVAGTAYAGALAVTADNPIDAALTLGTGAAFGAVAKGLGAGSRLVKAGVTAKVGVTAAKVYRTGEVAVSKVLVPGYFAYEGVTAGVELSKTLAEKDYEAFEKQSGELATGFGAFILGVKAGEKLIDPFVTRTTGKAVYRESLFEAPKEVAAQAKQLEVGLKRVQEYPHPVRELKIESERIPRDLAKAFEEQITLQRKELIVKGSQVAKLQMSKDVMARLGVDIDIVAKPKLGRSEMDIARDFFKETKTKYPDFERLSFIEKPKGEIVFAEITYKGAKVVEFSRYEHFTKQVAEIAGYLEPVSSFIVKTPKGVQMFELIGQTKRKARSGIFEEKRFEKDVADAMKAIESQKRIAAETQKASIMLDLRVPEKIRPKKIGERKVKKPTALPLEKALEKNIKDLAKMSEYKYPEYKVPKQIKALYPVLPKEIAEVLPTYKPVKEPAYKLPKEVADIYPEYKLPKEPAYKLPKKPAEIIPEYKPIREPEYKLPKEPEYKLPKEIVEIIPEYKPITEYKLPKEVAKVYPEYKPPKKPAEIIPEYKPIKEPEYRLPKEVAKIIPEYKPITEYKLPKEPVYKMPEYKPKEYLETPSYPEYRPPKEPSYKVPEYPTTYKPAKIPEYPYKPVTEPYKTGFDEIYKKDFYKEDTYPKDDFYKDDTYPKDDFYKDDTYPKDDFYRKDRLYDDDYTRTRITRDDLLLFPPKLREKKLGIREIPTQAWSTHVRSKGTKVKGKFRAGKFVKVSKKPLTRMGALGKGAIVADETVARSFKIEKIKGKPKPSIWGSAWNALSFKFRPKIVKGKPRGPKNRYIEKTDFAIDSISEVQGITVKGWQARQRKASRLKIWGLEKPKKRKGRKRSAGFFI